MIVLQGEIDESTVTVGEFNTPVSERGRSSKQKIHEGRAELNDTIN